LGNVHSERAFQTNNTSISDSKSDRQDSIVKECEELLLQSEAQWKNHGKTLRKQRRKDLAAKLVQDNSEVKKTWKDQTKEIEALELQRSKAAGECQRCPWPKDRKGSFKTIDCFCWKRVEKGIVSFPEGKQYQRD